MKKITASFLLACPDKTGIVAKIAGFFHLHDVNILSSQNYSEGNTFFMRVVGDISHLAESRESLEQSFQVIAQQLDAQWSVQYSDYTPNMAILVSHEDATLHELISLQRIGELNCRIPCILSNHDKLRSIAEFYDIPFHYLPITDAGKRAQEMKIEAILKEAKIDLVVLARYMQILTPEFCTPRFGKIINIHHGFLPAFQGAKPYHQAFRRGVKLIGATAHYVTAELDQGPIIEQDVIRVSHQHSVRQLINLGRDVERRVLARAVKLHLEHRILIHKQKTIIF
ncbi:MAG: formyltetrahydrofolate deformylase [Lentisphaerae bacterium]|nr:MAG: formyltetrahydrofolate deformylase [Lentisphaerota bacterium]